MPLFLVAFADSPADDASVPLMHAQARVVQVDVVVTDSNGKPVAGLSKDDFTVTDNNKPRGIDIFSLGSEEAMPVTLPSEPLPLHVFSNRNRRPASISHSTVILLDANPADPKSDEYKQYLSASGQAKGLIFSLRPDERIALYVVSRAEGMLLLQDFTSDRAPLLKAMAGYKPRGIHIGGPFFVYEKPKDRPDMPPATQPTESPRRDPNFVPKRETDYQTDSSVRENRLSLQTLAERLALVPGRKNVFWATTGFSSALIHDMGQIPWDHTIAALNEANVALNTVSGCFSAQIEIAERTEGSALCNGGPSAASLITASRTTYTLGFYLQESERDDAFHSLKVKVNRSHVELFYRQGYFAGKTQDALHERRPELETALLNQVDSTGVGITARVETTSGSPRGALDIRLNLDAATLSLGEKTGGWMGNVEEIFVQTNENGNTLAKVSDNKEFEVTAADRAGFDSEGVSWPMSIPLVDGAIKLTIVVRDSKTGHLGSLTIPLP